MATLSELVVGLDLGPDDVEHLQRLVAGWGMVADFCFADLLLWAPVGSDEFVVLGQIRPTTSQTLYQDDLVGRVVATRERPQLADTLGRGQIVQGQHRALDGPGAARVEYIPVRRIGRVLAVMTREEPLDTVRRPGRLERTYLEIFDRLAAMVAAGVFPFPADDESEETARVGDGVVVLDGAKRARYASPNAVSALHRMGTFINTDGRSLAELGVSSPAVDLAYERMRPQVAEVWSGVGAARVVVQLRVIPLGIGAPAEGAVVLVRDVSDLRRRDRLLISKDATIREVHHRVKNNLQTIASLLRLQGRRMTTVEAKQAIDESVRRIRSIALVHETLSRDTNDTVPFGEIVRPLVRMVEEGLQSPELPVHLSVEGDAGDLAPEVATPLAVVLTELLQNAVEHGYPEGTGRKKPGSVVVTLHNSGDELAVTVRDDGIGLPEGFTASGSTSLGLSIARTLVTSELGGAIAFRNDGGAVVELRIPTRQSPRIDR